MSSLDFGLLTPYARDINVGTEAGAKAYSKGSLAGSIEKKDRTKLTVQSAEKVRDQIKHGHNDVYTYKQMLEQDDCPMFLQAMQDEIATHTRRDHWELMLKESKFVSQQE